MHNNLGFVNKIKKTMFLVKELDRDEDNSPGLSVCVKILTQIWKTYKIGMKTRKLLPGAVVASSGVVVTGEGCPFLIFLNGFCREDGGDSFYGDGFSKMKMVEQCNDRRRHTEGGRRRRLGFV
ncbi:hypothetical protein MtrunA17_Chr4g0049771 [Medicago truncatula]|uniref:Uncharacterized protein n=2 Tax=Medicago truncatula TaxID=3880 RepID=A0A396IAL9_MEDTR|nr:hypothetical protein MtrunA17_Chr4g0049771 [Medicago truncatula]